MKSNKLFHRCRCACCCFVIAAPMSSCYKNEKCEYIFLYCINTLAFNENKKTWTNFCFLLSFWCVVCVWCGSLVAGWILPNVHIYYIFKRGKTWSLNFLHFFTFIFVSAYIFLMRLLTETYAVFFAAVSTWFNIQINCFFFLSHFIFALVLSTAYFTVNE